MLIRSTLIWTLNCALPDPTPGSGINRPAPRSIYALLDLASLVGIARIWNLLQVEAARRLEPGGAIYHEMDEVDVRRELAHPKSIVGSNGPPNDPRPHRRLWGTFPRVLRHLRTPDAAIHRNQRYG
ncbi:hypothetical protein DM872_10770 [Pseudomonas taiwanensis]|uniref:hypothetical protein n=1 Tax=Pseudomonas taiwanensis TaxID=470150 RepID=UPI0015B892D3|nr:hypothetical protein [Pseudomonas taiwanensis]